MPDSPLAATSAGVTTVLIVPFVSRTFTGPGRSVKNIVPSDRKDMSHGLLRPVTKFAVASVGEFGSTSERPTPDPLPRRLQELKTSEKSIAGIDRPVPAALALRESVPHAGPETGVPTAPDHADEHRHGRAAPDPGLDLHDLSLVVGSRRSPPSGKATR